jgi:peptidoglycan/LPS O-acetylase OafA/YrhL
VLMQAVGYFNYCLNIYWSLSVEEVFYLTFPLACVALKRDRRIIALCIAAIIVGPVYRSFHTDNEIYFMYAYPACFDAIAFGCLSALVQRRLSVGRNLGILIRCVSGAGLAACYFAGIDGHEVLGFSMIALCSAGLLTNAFESSAQVSRSRAGRMVGWFSRIVGWFGRIVGWFGRHSYELYLFHIILLAGIRDLIPQTALAYGLKLPLFALFLALSGLFAGFVARYFADPVNARLRRILAGGAKNLA